MPAVWAVLLSLGTLAFASGLVGLVSGRLDKTFFANRRRLALLTVAGLLLVFAGSAPPTRAAGEDVWVPAAPTNRLRTLLLQMETLWATQPVPGVVPEQQRAYEKWERQVLTAYGRAEQALERVPAVLSALKEGRLDRFTAWMHLARLKQDTNQARLAATAVVPPAILDWEMKERLKQALDSLNESLLGRRRYIAHLQHHVKTMKADELKRAVEEAAGAALALEEAAFDIIWVKARLGLARERPAPTAVHLESLRIAAAAPARADASPAAALAHWTSWPAAACADDPPAWR